MAAVASIVVLEAEGHPGLLLGFQYRHVDEKARLLQYGLGDAQGESSEPGFFKGLIVETHEPDAVFFGQIRVVEGLIAGFGASPEIPVLECPLCDGDVLCPRIFQVPDKGLEHRA